MTTVVLRGREIASELDLHRALAAALDFGPYYGKNLDALWDRLTTDVERPVHLVWQESSESRRQLGDELFDKIVALLRDVAASDVTAGYAERFTVEILG
ncbi:barstar family protein [Actinoplanes sp. DH11]|uniref:barstar family protein n=1 Tax=Actinoplanes sp. DH11 TaxID=2857011 RepID=UPI001E4D7FA1|nr:barstar family protein [Actinoplanes sp. DH11]